MRTKTLSTVSFVPTPRLTELQVKAYFVCLGVVFITYESLFFAYVDGCLIGMAYDGKKSLFTTHSLCQNVQGASVDTSALEASTVIRDFPYKSQRWSIILSQTSNEAIVPLADGMLLLIVE